MTQSTIFFHIQLPIGKYRFLIACKQLIFGNVFQMAENNFFLIFKFNFATKQWETNHFLKFPSEKLFYEKQMKPKEDFLNMGVEITRIFFSLTCYICYMVKFFEIQETQSVHFIQISVMYNRI